MDVNEALALVRDLSPEERANLQATVAQSPSISLWSPLPGPQTQAYTSTADEVFYGGAAGGGKFGATASACNGRRLGYDLASDSSAEAHFMKDVHHVYTPFGPKLIDDIAVGDAVLNPDGTTARVIAATPVHVRPSYRVSFNDGTSVVVGDRHIWPIKLSGKRPRRRDTTGDGFSLDTLSGGNPQARFALALARQYRLYTTQELASLVETAAFALACDQRPHHPLVPLTEPVNTQRSPGRASMIPPYTLGVLLGDGSLGGATPVWSKPSREVADCVAAELQEYAAKESPWTRDVVSPHADGETWGLVGGSTRQGLQSLGLYGKRAWEKFIPPQYLHGPVDLRRSLLQGMMDTDGYIDARGQSYWCTASLQMAQDFLYLARSLGYYARQTVKDEPRYTYKDEERIGRPSYQVYITGRNRSDLVRADLKKYRAAETQGEGGKRVIRVEPVGGIEGRCIQVSNPNGLYLTNDFTVTHNSALIVGMALTKHRRTLIIRRESTQLRGLIDDIARTLKTRDGLNNQAGQWRIPAAKSLFPDQLIEFGGVPNPGDEERHQGIPHDLLAFDEVTQLTEYVINYLTTWNRTIHPEQPCRMILTSNPPTPSTQYGIRGRSSGGGTWIVRRYAPWLNPQYRDPHGLGKAEPGELRWFVTLDGVEQEWPDPLPFVHYDTKNRREEIIQPRSRTFIPALASQNPYTGDAYIATLQKLPEPLRSALLYGDFSVSLTDQPLQLFPSDWVRSATLRHSSTPMPGYPGYPPSDTNRRMTAIGADIARGGADTTVLMLRYGQWFAPPVLLSKAETADGPSAGAAIVKHRRDQAQIVIDANGVGASVYDHLRNNAPDDGNIKAHVGSVASTARDRSNRYGFTNRRSEVYWKLREALDPSSPYQLCIPNDEELIEELLSLTWEEQSGRIKVMSKKDHIQVLGRSPDKADALTLAWSVRDDEDPQEDRAMTAREERLADARGDESWHRGGREPGRRARWSDRELPYPRRY